MTEARKSTKMKKIDLSSPQESPERVINRGSQLLECTVEQLQDIITKQVEARMNILTCHQSGTGEIMKTSDDLPNKIHTTTSLADTLQNALEY